MRAEILEESRILSPSRPRRVPLRAADWAPFAVALLLTLVCTSVPTLCARTDVDSSWCAMLDYAHTHHLQFGKDIVFTYGPLGFLVTPYFSPTAAGMRLATAALLCFGASLGISLLAWRLTLLWRALWLGAFVFVAGNIHSGADVLLNLAVVAWGLLCLLEQRRLLWLAVFAFTICAAFGVLVKLTYLLTMGVSVAAISSALLLRGKRRQGVGMAAGFLGGVLLLWVVAGQDLSNLGAYLTNGWQVCAGFDQAMATDCPRLVLQGAVALLLLALITVGLRAFSFDTSEIPFRWTQRALLCGWLLALLFVTWKHGLIRADRHHIEFFLFFVPLVLLGLEAVPSTLQFPRELARALAVVCCALAALILPRIFFPSYLQFCLRRPWHLAIENAHSLLQPQRYLTAMDERFQAESQTCRLPKLNAAIGRSSMDVFGWSQALAVFNGLNLHPRPVFQSYGAYNVPLMRLNEKFFLASNRPEFVLFNLAALDDRFPALDDAWLLRDLLLNYQLVDGEGSLLLLKAAGCAQPRMTLLREGSAPLGEPIYLPENASNVWMEVAVEPTLLGRAARMLYRSGTVHMKVLGATGVVEGAEFGTPTPMLAAGFLASPLLLGNADVVDLYTGNPGCHPKAYAVDVPAAEKSLWKSSVHFRLYQIENNVGHSVSAPLQRLKFPGFEVLPTQINSPSNPIVLIKGKPVLRSAGRRIDAVDIVSGSNVVLSVSGKPGLLLPPGGSMHLRIPAGAQFLRGSYGVADGSIADPVEFRIEVQSPDGTSSVLLAQHDSLGTSTNKPGLKQFQMPLPSMNGGTILLRTVASPTDKQGQVLSCWADIGFEKRN